MVSDKHNAATEHGFIPTYNTSTSINSGSNAAHSRYGGKSLEQMFYLGCLIITPTHSQLTYQ
jgi:hypothetical protein